MWGGFDEYFTVYNAADDYVCDGLDSCEEALKVRQIKRCRIVDFVNYCAEAASWVETACFRTQDAGESGKNPTNSAKSAAVTRVRNPSVILRQRELSSQIIFSILSGTVKYYAGL